MRTVGKHAAVGALLGLVAVTVFALGTFDDRPDLIWPVRLVLALSLGGLFYGVPVGAAIGGIVGAVRLRSRRNHSAPVPSARERPVVMAGAEQQSAPWSLRPGDQQGAEADRRYRAMQAAGRPDVGQKAVQPVPLAALRPAPERSVPAIVDLSDPDRLNRVLDRLDGLPGLEAVAEQVRSMARRIEQDQRRRAVGLKVAETGLHALFIGPSGTGKTTVAQVWGEVLCATGLLPTDKVVEVDRSDLVGETVGSTGPKTLAAIQRAMGGVLFIDEAYSLAPPVPGNDFGGESIAALLRAMESKRGKFAVICAGYEEEMARFLRSNSGLKSRFSRTVTFPHYDAAALLSVLDTMAEQSDYAWDDGARRVLLSGLTRLCAAPPEGWANARECRDLLDAAVSAQSDRIAGDNFADLRTLTEDDARSALQRLHPGSV